MELAVIIFLTIIGLLVFKQPIRLINRWIITEIQTEINDSQKDLIETSTEAYNEIVEEFGEDFMTPNEVYNLLHSSSSKRKNMKEKMNRNQS